VIREKDFTEEECIAEGCFGIVYRGVLHRDNSVIAIKKLAPFADRMASVRFLREIETLGSLPYPTVVPLVGFKACGASGPIIVTKFCKNGSLGALLAAKWAGRGFHAGAARDRPLRDRAPCGSSTAAATSSRTAVCSARATARISRTSDSRGPRSAPSRATSA
jgi:hypothetical protein